MAFQAGALGHSTSRDRGCCSWFRRSSPQVVPLPAHRPSRSYLLERSQLGPCTAEQVKQQDTGRNSAQTNVRAGDSTIIQALPAELLGPAAPMTLRQLRYRYTVDAIGASPQRQGRAASITAGVGPSASRNIGQAMGRWRQATPAWCQDLTGDAGFYKRTPNGAVAPLRHRSAHALLLAALHATTGAGLRLTACCFLATAGWRRHQIYRFSASCSNIGASFPPCKPGREETDLDLLLSQVR